MSRKKVKDTHCLCIRYVWRLKSARYQPCVFLPIKQTEKVFNKKSYTLDNFNNYTSIFKIQTVTFYPQTKSEGYSFGVVRASVSPSIRPSIHSVRPSRPSVRLFCLSGTITQYLLIHSWYKG